jgi:hypothetical protein
MQAGERLDAINHTMTATKEKTSVQPADHAELLSSR